MKQYFGTDGIRGIPNKTLNEDLVSKIFSSVEKELSPVSVAVILDTRSSSLELLSWICNGLSEKVEVVNYGVLPSGSMPILLEKFGHDLGVIISASHNPSEYNGIKLINDVGSKLSDDVEINIENNLQTISLPEKTSISKSSTKGYDAYLEYLESLIDFDLSSFNILFDTANGSSYKIIEDLFQSKKSKFKIISNTPDGQNINSNCGATHLDNLISNLGKNQLGAAFDGDADRLILVDETGAPCNGDVIILLIAKYLEAINKLNNNIVVSTVMSNFGFKKAVEKNNYHNVETSVGDKYVAAAMSEHNASLGGEQSGHIIISDELPVGDGLVSFIYSLKALAFFNTTLAEFRDSNIIEYPQKLINLELDLLPSEEQVKELNEIANNLYNEIGLDGRFLIRKSGTEPILRVLVEAESEEELANFSEKLIISIKNHLFT
ncbi:MAG: phosphoglucosamine mutase [Candidatus Actinomarina sp.]